MNECNLDIKDSPTHRHLQSLSLSLSHTHTHTHTHTIRKTSEAPHPWQPEFVVNLSSPSALELQSPQAVF